MALPLPSKLKIPGESTTQPSFASPQIQTAPDVRQSQAVTGGNPAPPAPATPAAPKSSSLLGPEGQPAASNPQAPSSTLIPNASSTGAPAGVAPSTPTVPTSTGAPPGVPATTPPPAVTPPLPPSPKALEGHNSAENEKIQAENQRENELYEAAMKYDGGPASELAENQRRAEASLKTSTANRGAAGTIESSLYGGDKTLIGRNLADANLKSYLTYQSALKAANDAWAKAQIVYERAGEQEKREIAEAAERRQPTSPIAPAPEPPQPDKYGWVHTPRGSYRLGGPR